MAAPVYITIMQDVHRLNLQGSPVMFLLVAPLSVASLALVGLNGSYGACSQALFGSAFFLFCLLLRSGPRIFEVPTFLGLYWAYVFPLAALATSAIANAKEEDSATAHVLAWVLIVMAEIALLIVFVRMVMHMCQQGQVIWDDKKMLEDSLDAALTCLDIPTQVKSPNNAAVESEERLQPVGDLEGGLGPVVANDGSNTSR